ncbi:hypothetical protein [Pandoraea sputorum]|uniref:Uncharacterized protein n=1 Tax=Pandoraea sputorum TaxID=93222 RepID=A0A5E5BGC0_9BURK|nr:hypothetical protein [Pandoraea sputorum]VVE84959.1 hypothetical protein PSP31121_05014 [Pandoraea sputorum]
MTHDEVLKTFEDLYVEGRVAPLDDALAAYAGWIAAQRERLNEDDVAVLMSAGGALFKAGMAKRVADAIE